MKRNSSHLISKDTQTDRVVNTLRKYIVLGQFPPGTHLRVDTLAKKLSISRVPLREALRQLNAEGLISAYPHRSAIVADINKVDVVDSFYMLKIVELVAAERAAKENHVATGKLMKERYKTLQAVTNSSSNNGDYLDAHKNFHFSVFEQQPETAAALERSASILWHSCERFIYAAQVGERVQQSDHEHYALANAMSNGDVSAVKAITAMHVEHASESALKGLGFM